MKTKNSQSAKPGQPASGLEQAPRKIKPAHTVMRGQALIIVLLFLVLCTFIAIAFLTNVTSSGVGENAAASENRASQLATTAVQLVEGTITNATVSGTFPTVAWACQPGMIRTYGASAGANGASYLPLYYYKLYSSGTMVVTNTMDMNPNDIFSADVPPTWNKMPSYYTDLNAPLFVTNPATSGTTEVFPIADPRAADSDIAVSGFSYSNSMPGSTGNIYGVITNGTSGLYANDTTSRLAMPVAWIYVLKDGTLTVPPPPASGVSSAASWPANATNAPTSTNPIVGRVAFWTDDECGKINVNTASEGTYWDAPFTNAGQLTDVFTTGTVALGDAGFAEIQPATHEYQRYPGHPATTCLSTVFGNALANSGLMRADIVKAITDAVPRISDYAKSDPDLPTGSLTTTMGGTVQSGTSGSVITDEDRLYTNLDEFQFQPNRTPQHLNTLMSGSAAQEEQNDVDTCRFFLTAHSKAPEVNLFGLPRVAIWPVWADTLASQRTTFDSEIARCATLNSSGTNPHEMFISRANPLSATADYAGIPRNQQIMGYLRSMTGSAVPGYGKSFFAKYNVSNSGVTDRDQILAEIFDYIRSTNLSDNSAGATPYTTGTTASSPANVVQTGQVIPIQIPATTGTSNAQGLGRIATISEMALVLTKVDDRINTTAMETGTNLAGQVTVNGYPAGSSGSVVVNPAKQTLVEWALIPRLSSPMAGYVALANNIRIRFPSINLTIAGQTYSAGTSSSSGTTPDLYDIGRISCEQRDSVMGGNIGAETLVEAAYHSLQGSPSDSMYPTGLAVVTGTGLSGNPANNTITISGNMTVNIYSPATSGSSIGPQIQTMSFAFPSTQVPIPHLFTSGTAGNTWYGTFRAPSSVYTVSGSNAIFSYPAVANKSSLPRINGASYNTYIAGAVYSGEGGTDVVRSLSPTGPLAGVSGSNIMGDIRLVAISPTISSTTTFQLTLGSGGVTPASTTYCANALRLGTVINVSGNAHGTLISSAAASKYGSPPEVPPQASGTIPASGPALGAGDWDNGPGLMYDGPWANKPDEGMVGTNGANTYAPYIGYYESTTQSQAQETTLFSPNRQISSPVMFGSLPVGVDQPWRTLLFRPAALPGYQESGNSSYTHLGNANASQALPDHVLLDLFWMPVVEPYGISEPLATSGKINVNTQIAPFTYINRTTGLEAVLKSVMITALNPAPSSTVNFIGSYKTPYFSSQGSGLSNNPTVTTRYPIDTHQTAIQLSGSDQTNAYPEFGRPIHSGSTPNFFVSADQICDMPLIPIGYTPSTLYTFWNNNALTGDNSLERPYSMIYPRLTSKSNIFTVHVIAQSLKQVPSDLANGTWTENVSQVTGEVRGSYTIEKYYDPNADDLSYYKSASSGVVAYTASSDGAIPTTGSTVALRGARWRLLNVKRFGQ